MSRHPIKNLDFENKNGIEFQNLEFLTIGDSQEFTEFGNVEGMFPKVIDLNCDSTYLKNIENISKVFPNLNSIDFYIDKYLTDITPLLDYNRGFS